MSTASLALAAGLLAYTAGEEAGRVLRTELSSLRTKLLRILAYGFNLSRIGGQLV